MSPSVDNPLLSSDAMAKLTGGEKAIDDTEQLPPEMNTSQEVYQIQPKHFGLVNGISDDTTKTEVPITEKETWDNTISRVISGIVSVKATIMRSYDTENSGDYTATGFVIDAKEGLILSNRHVVSPAPINAVAVFLNYEVSSVAIPIFVAVFYNNTN